MISTGETLSEKIESAIGKMADQVKAQQDGQKILHCSQAALNLAHTKCILEGRPVSQSRKTS